MRVSAGSGSEATTSPAGQSRAPGSPRRLVSTHVRGVLAWGAHSREQSQPALERWRFHVGFCVTPFLLKHPKTAICVFRVSLARDAN